MTRSASCLPFPGASALWLSHMESAVREVIIYLETNPNVHCARIEYPSLDLEAPEGSRVATWFLGCNIKKKMACHVVGRLRCSFTGLGRRDSDAADFSMHIRVI